MLIQSSGLKSQSVGYACPKKLDYLSKLRFLELHNPPEGGELSSPYKRGHGQALISFFFFLHQIIQRFAAHRVVIGPGGGVNFFSHCFLVAFQQSGVGGR